MSESIQPIILHLETVSKQFSRHEPAAVNQVTLDLYEGELVSFLGPSGCGKTTLLRLIAGFERPQSGAIAIAETVVAGKGQWVPPERREVGMVFQDYALFPHLNVQKNIAFGLRNLASHKHHRIEVKLQKRIEEVLELVGLSGFADRYPHELSGGQQQRVALARALAPSPRLILLDEPLSNLDVQVRLRLRQELREILKSSHTSAIFVTHDQEEALSIADRVAVMRGGQLEQFGTPEEIYGKPISKFVAEFVTQANFLPVWQDGDRNLATDLGCFDLNILSPDTSAETIKAVLANYDEGMRSEHISTKALLADYKDPIKARRLARQNTQQDTQSVGQVDRQHDRHDRQMPSSSSVAMELMIRQEDLLLELDDTAETIIHDRQFLGREHRYIVQTPAGTLINVLDRRRSILPIGGKVKVAIVPHSALLFPASLAATPGLTV
jgi:iron(III) transport system ATP-binding protein